MCANSRFTGTARGGIALFEVVVVIGIVATLLALLIPAVQAAREAARRNSCNCKFKQITLAMHNHHDVYKRFPSLTSTAVRGVTPGSISTDGSPGAGLSWLVQILPYIEEVSLYNSIDQTCGKAGRDAFDPAVTAANKNSPTGKTHPATICIGTFVCPSYRVELFSDASEYAKLSSVPTGEEDVGCCGGGSGAADQSSLQSGQRIGAAVSTTVAIPATHLALMLNDPDQPNTELPNGCIVPPPQTVAFRDVKDGTSKTLIVTESREHRYSSWYDGTVGWVVMADPNGPDPVRNTGTGFLDAQGQSSLGIGPDNDPPAHYLSNQLLPTLAADWNWGPSSFHSGSVLMFGVADGSVRSFTPDIDPTLLLRLTTRADKEPANLPE